MSGRCSGPPTRYPSPTSRPVRVASRIVVRSPAFQFACVAWFMSPTTDSGPLVPDVSAAVPGTSIVHSRPSPCGVVTRFCMPGPPQPGELRLWEAMKRPSLLSQIVALNLLMVTAGHPGRDLRGRIRLLDLRPALAVPRAGDGDAPHLPAQHAAAAAPVRAPGAAAGDDGAGRPLAARAAPRARSRDGRASRRRSSGWRPPSTGCWSASRTSGAARASSCCGPRRRSAGASPATSTTRSTSRSRRCCCGSRPSTQDAPARAARRSSRRPSSSPTRRWASCSTSPASCARPRSTTTAWSRRSRPTCATSTAADRRARASGRIPRMGELSPDAQVVVYRVAQEALVNAARHSGATRVEVNLEPRDSQGAPGGVRQRVGLRLRRGGQGPRACRACASARCWSAARSRSTPGRARARRSCWRSRPSDRRQPRRETTPSSARPSSEAA